MIETWAVIQRNKGVESRPAAVAENPVPPSYSDALTNVEGAVDSTLQCLQWNASQREMSSTSFR